MIRAPIAVIPIISSPSPTHTLHSSQTHVKVDSIMTMVMVIVTITTVLVVSIMILLLLIFHNSPLLVLSVLSENFKRVPRTRALSNLPGAGGLSGAYPPKKKKNT